MQMVSKLLSPALLGQTRSGSEVLLLCLWQLCSLALLIELPWGVDMVKEQEKGKISTPSSV